MSTLAADAALWAAPEGGGASSIWTLPALRAMLAPVERPREHRVRGVVPDAAATAAAAVVPRSAAGDADVAARSGTGAGADALALADATDAADRADIAACLGGDGPAFARIVERHQQAIARLMHRFARDHATHEALVQDTFVEAWRSLKRYRGDAPLLHWLRVLGTRVGYRHWRSTARTRLQSAAPEAALDGVAAAHDGRVEAREAAEIVHALLARLSPRDRLVLTLLHLEGCAVEEIARLTGWSRVMVKVQAHRARKRLAALLPAGLAPGGGGARAPGRAQDRAQGPGALPAPERRS